MKKRLKRGDAGWHNDAAQKFIHLYANVAGIFEISWVGGRDKKCMTVFTLGQEEVKLSGSKPKRKLQAGMSSLILEYQQMNRMNPKVDAYLIKAKKWREEFEKLRMIALGCGLTEELKWGKPCYSFQESNIVIIQGFKEHCALLFCKGALLK
ncbi:MAG: DUF1801 domain-containing protein, partial [Chthoniobacteraceae bacterium]